MEVSLKGSAYELKTFFAGHLVGDPISPPPPPPVAACELSGDECAQLHSILTALSQAATGSFLTTAEGSIVAIAHPTSQATMVWAPDASDWVPGGWPP